MTQIQLATGSAQNFNAWASGTAYNTGNQVLYQGQMYYAQSNFTSGASFVADGALWQVQPVATATLSGGTGTTTINSAVVNTGQYLHSVGGADPTGNNPSQFASSGIQTGISTAGQYSYDSTTLNTFQLMSYVNNTGTGPTVAGSFWGVGRHVWALNPVAYSVGGPSAVAIGSEFDVGNLSTISDTISVTTPVTANMTIPLTSGVGAVAPGNLVYGAAVFSYTGVAANSVTNANLILGSVSSLVSGHAVVYSAGGSCTGITVSCEGGGQGGSPVHAAYQVSASTAADGCLYGFLINGIAIHPSGAGIQFQNNTCQQGIAFNTGTFAEAILLSGVTASGGLYINGGTFSASPIYLSGTSSTGAAINLTGITAPAGLTIASSTINEGILLSGLTATSGIQFNGGTYSGAFIYLNGSSVTGINFSSATLSGYALVFGDGQHIQTGTGAGTKIAVTPSEKLGFWGTTPVAQPSTTGTSSGFTANSGTAMNSASTSTGGMGASAYNFNDIVLALKQVGILN